MQNAAAPAITYTNNTQPHHTHQPHTAPTPTRPQVAVGDIMAVQTMFARSFPLSLFDHKLSAADEASTVTLLMSMQVLLLHVLHVLHVQCITPACVARTFAVLVMWLTRDAACAAAAERAAGDANHPVLPPLRYRAGGACNADGAAFAQAVRAASAAAAAVVVVVVGGVITIIHIIIHITIINNHTPTHPPPPPPHPHPPSLDAHTLLQHSLTSRGHLVIIFPVLLLCMRVVIETLMRNAFPSLFDRPQLSFR